MKRKMGMNKQKKKKAFTLTELLVVVVVIGVLSAVALPRFTRAIETRKTGEAEEMLSAIRGEQEKRCELDKPYAGHFDKLGDLVAGGSKTAQTVASGYTYNLAGGGVTARRSGKDYALAIPSYADGRLCCDGAYCERLNKDYPSCTELSARGDYRPANAACMEEEPPLTPCEADPGSCECNPDQCKCAAYSASHCECTGTCAKTCDAASKPAASCNQCGTRSVSCDTVTGAWKTGACSVASASDCPGSQCTAGQTDTQTCGNCGTKTRTCDNGYWGEWGQCSDEGECAAHTTQREACDEDQTGEKTRTCSASCTWGAWDTQSCKPKSNVNPVVRTGVTIASCSSSGRVTGYSVYKSGSNEKRKQSHRNCECVYEGRYIDCTSEIYSPSTFAQPEGYGDVGNSCSGSDYQAICDAQGAGYTCVISAEPECGTEYEVIDCDCDTDACNSDRNEECECMEVDGPYPVEYADGYGSATYLSCEAK